MIQQLRGFMNFNRILSCLVVAAALATVIYVGYYLTLGYVLVHFIGKVW